MSNFVVEEQRGAAALEALRPEWQALFSAPGAPPFLSWEWLSAWQQSFGDNKTPRLLGVRAGGTLVGPAPSDRRRTGQDGFRHTAAPLLSRRRRRRRRLPGRARPARQRVPEHRCDRRVACEGRFSRSPCARRSGRRFAKSSLADSALWREHQFRFEFSGAYLPTEIA